MSISYNLGIPDATHNPSVDQPNMKVNNDNIATYVSVDHVGFGVSAPAVSGQHKQVTFNSNNVPSSPVSPPVLFTNTVVGLPQLFFYSGSAANGANQYVASANGSTFLLGGIILKWGSSAVIGGGGTNFTPAFPNNCFSVIVVGTSALYTGGFVVTSVTASNFIVARTTGSGATGYYYIAVGN